MKISRQCFVYLTQKKNKVVLIILMLALSNIAYSQNLSIGIKDGLSRSDIKFQNNNYRSNSLKGGRNYGLMLNYQITNFLSVQSELYHSDKGFKFYRDLPSGYTGGGLHGNYKMSYTTIPLSANFEIGKSFKFYGYGGLYISFLNSAGNQITLVSNSIPDLHHDLSYDPTSEFNRSDKVALFGLGVKIPLCNKVKLFVDTRYETGITKAVNENAEFGDYHVIGDFKDVYNRSFSISWGILYRFKSPD